MVSKTKKSKLRKKLCISRNVLKNWTWRLWRFLSLQRWKQLNNIYHFIQQNQFSGNTSKFVSGQVSCWSSYKELPASFFASITRVTNVLVVSLLRGTRKQAHWLVTPWPHRTPGHFGVTLCQNIMIYVVQGRLAIFLTS